MMLWMQIRVFGPRLDLFNYVLILVDLRTRVRVFGVFGNAVFGNTVFGQRSA